MKLDPAVGKHLGAQYFLNKLKPSSLLILSLYDATRTTTRPRTRPASSSPAVSIA